MKYPNFNEEKKLWKKGYKYVVGLDEAGRGPLAGPVVAGAVIINFKFEILNFKLQIRDSKQLLPKKREEIYNILIKNPDIAWGIGIVSEKMIDKINILEATKLAMKKALRQAQGKLKIKRSVHKSRYRVNCEPSCFLILDGNFKLNLCPAAFVRQSAGFGEPKQKSIIKADQKVFSVAAASIIAKVTRDRIMQKEHKKYPEYGFDKHKGYPTKAHFASLQKFGPCKIHRKTFWPVRGL